jgi:hypothetical protein
MVKMLDYNPPHQELTLIFDDFAGKGYHAAYIMEDGTTWIKRDIVTISDALVQKNVTAYTEGKEYAVMPVKVGAEGNVVNAFISRNHEVVKEITFKLTNMERFRLFGFLTVDVKKK